MKKVKYFKYIVSFIFQIFQLGFYYPEVTHVIIYKVQSNIKIEYSKSIILKKYIFSSFLSPKYIIQKFNIIQELTDIVFNSSSYLLSRSMNRNNEVVFMKI